MCEVCFLCSSLVFSILLLRLLLSLLWGMGGADEGTEDERLGDLLEDTWLEGAE